jgi:hypothetical protein
VLCNELVRPRLIPKPLREPSVAFQVLPHVPIPHPDELLSSWIERIGLFYGIGYLGARIILEPNRANNEHGQVDDIDSSASIRQQAMRWSGLPEKFVPVLLCRRDEEVLELSARLTYCPDCWNQDVKKDTSPYVRRNWATWSAVACWKHNKWLSAREPHGRVGSDLNGWAPVWQTDITWARGQTSSTIRRRLCWRPGWKAMPSQPQIARGRISKQISTVWRAYVRAASLCWLLHRSCSA